MTFNYFSTEINEENKNEPQVEGEKICHSNTATIRDNTCIRQNRKKVKVNEDASASSINGPEEDSGGDTGTKETCCSQTTPPPVTVTATSGKSKTRCLCMSHLCMGYLPGGE